MKLYNKMLLVCTSILSVVFISNGTTFNTIVNADDTLSVSNVKEAVDKLINAKNYTLEISTKIGPIDIAYEVYYTENGFYDNFLGDEYGYAAVDEGVFRFDLYNRKFTASSLLKDVEGNKLTTIWDTDNNLFYGFHKFNMKDFENATGKEYEATGKRVKNTFLNLFHINFGKYQYVNPVKFTVSDNINTLQFEFSLKTGEKYVGKIKNFGTTKIDVIDEYLSEGKSYHKNDGDLDKIISLFANYNYTRLIYDDKVDGYDVIAGQEMYDKDYFYTFFDDQYLVTGAGYEIGMVGIDKTYGPIEANGKTYGPYNFSGSYYCFISEDANGNQVLDVMTSLPINTDPFVPNVYNYPTFLMMFNESQYLDTTGAGVAQYYTSKLACVKDFVKNFQMTDTLSSIGAVPTGVFVEYYPNGCETYAGTQGKETVVFGLEVNYYGAFQTIPFVYTDFNSTYIECITQENIDKVIYDAIQRVIDKDANLENGGE